ncbi:hypothetical protein RHMOL_Rhmol13G0099700 [Rhododendron molle]|uniref:Uncharacterized protein n=1 Tax=Rhododendron molle TaxID=49168 RepID=A0ACC0L5G6_RHOML|nr:hypothetical protein RHMOL_Rhmol13G0099700 [Rhododendron molle]
MVDRFVFRMKERKSVKFNLQQQLYQNGHLSPFNLAKLLDPDASWDKHAGKQTPSSPLLDFYLRDTCTRRYMSEGRILECIAEDQLGDVLHWIRQVVALVCGLLWGAIPLVGGTWIVVFLVISSGIRYAYYAMILKIDEEEFGGHGALLQEGLLVSIMLFLLAWILIYSLAHF